MKLSKYIVIKKYKKRVILFSTISKTIIEVNPDFYEELQKIDINHLKNITKEELEFLKNNYFLIEKDVVEENIIEYLLDKDRLDQKIFSSYIAFSTLCNFACVYCYEEGQTHREKIMDEETLQATINWYKKIIEKNNYTKCNIGLFGGEPLLHKDLIKEFITQIGSITKKKKIELNINITTNGYLLDNDIINFLNLYGLDEIQITIDGVGDVHNQRRPLRSGGKTFDKIIRNIKNSEKFNGRFLFRVSFDENNIKEVKDVLKYLKNINIKNDYTIYLAPIHQTTSQQNKNCSFCSTNVLQNNQKIIDTYKEIYDYMKKLDLKIPKYYTNGPCMVVSNDTVLIDPYGDLYKCVEMISLKGLCVGNVKEKEYSQQYYNFVGRPQFKNCIKKQCKYVALCGGGCAMQSYLKDKKAKCVNCEYEYFEQLIPFFLEENYGNK